MLKNQQHLLARLAEARQQLAQAQARVTNLEAILANPDTPAVPLLPYEVQYSHLLDNIPEGCQLIGFDWRYLYINPVAVRHGRRPKEELLGYTMMECYPGIDETPLFAILERCMRERVSEQLENDFTYPDGKQGQFELRIEPVPDGIFILSIDITERKAQERQLRYHASLQDNTSDAVIVTDMNFRIQSWNRAAERIYGWQASEVVDQSSIELLRTEFLTDDTWQEIIQRLFENGWWQAEVVQHHRDGHTIPILGSVSLIKDEHGHSTAIVAVNRDISDRKVGEEALRESEARYRLLAENLTDMIAKINPEGIRTFVTPACYGLLGYQPAELIGRPVMEIVHPDDRAESDRVMKEALEVSRSSFTVVQRVRHKRGYYVWVEVLMSFVRDSDSNELVEIIRVSRDISERKAAEAILEARIEEEHQFQKYLKALHEITIELNLIEDLDTFYRRTVELGLERLGFERLALFLYNEAENTVHGTYGTDPEGRIVNEQHITFTPMPDTILLRAYHQAERFYFDGNTTLYKDMEPVGIGWNAATVLWHGDRGHGWLVADNLLSQQPASKPVLDILGLYGLTIGTLLAGKQAQLEMQQSEERFRMLVEAAPLAIVIVRQSGEIVLVNAQAEELFGYSRDEVLGKSVEMLVPEAARDKHIHHRAEYLAIPQMRHMQGLSMRARRKDGTEFPVETDLSAIETPQDLLVMSFIVDITERKKAEDVLLQALATEKELNELKSRFVSMASHEFRTPLASILALTETLIAYRHKLSESQINERFEKIKEQVGNLKDIMEDVLLLARLQARRVEVNPVLLNPDALLRSVLDEFQSQPDFAHHIVYDSDVELQQLMLDKKLMRQMMSNLVANAIKYSAADTKIMVTLQQVDGHLEIAVQDQGIGIPEEDFKHLFEPFHRASNVGAISGTGLGLVITKEAVELQGGVITVESQVGEGTRFAISIPVSNVDGADHDEDSHH